MKQKKTENYYQLNSIILPVIMLILLGLGLFAATRLTGLRQILKSKASSEKATIELGTSKTVTPEEAFEVPVMLSLKGQQIVAADVVLSFDKSILELKDITAKPDSSNNKLTTYLPRDNNGFNKNKVLQLANSTGRIEFGAVCFTASGCPENQTQDLGIANPLAILKFKTLKTGNTTLSILYSPNDKKNSNLITRAKEQVIGNSTPLNITAAALVAAPTAAPVIAPLTTTLTLSKTSGFVNGETITLNFTAQGGAGTKTIHTSVWEGIADPSQKTGEGNYQGFSGNTGQKTATVPFYVEYLATDNQNNRENAKTMLVTPAPAPTAAPTAAPTPRPTPVSTTTTNSAPANLRFTCTPGFVGNPYVSLLWDKISEASSYTVIFNGQTFSATNHATLPYNTYSSQVTKNAANTWSVKAFYSNGQSAEVSGPVATCP